MVRLVIGIVIVGLLVQADASEECSFEKEGNTIDFGKCNSGKGKLKVEGDHLNFKFFNKRYDPFGPNTITLTVGSCSLQCDVLGKLSFDPCLAFLDLHRTFYFPVSVKLSTDGYTIGDGEDAMHLPATCVYNPSQTDMIVEFNFNTREKIPGVKIIFENAHFFIVTDIKPEWKIRGWRLWIAIAVVICVALGITWWNKRARKKNYQLTEVRKEASSKRCKRQRSISSSSFK
ncbi:hypothetical protein M3Y94_01243600 [Aphelenchoides besseyi]|nr:hypothetical protein M3Y94_01243600 [Aphelenchoides besseyi]